MAHWVRHWPSLIILLALVCMHFQMGRWLTGMQWFRRSKVRVWGVWITAGALGLLVVVGGARVFQLGLPHPWETWVRAAGLIWALMSVWMFLALLVWRSVPKFNPSRRHLLRVTSCGLMSAPLAGASYAVFVQRTDIRVRETRIPISGLPKDLDGLRLVQLSDIHLSPFLSEKELAWAVDMANELRAHIALVTGDFITSRGDPIDASLRQMARLRADAGILGCLGNHEGYAGVEGYTAKRGARLGIRFLRSESRQLRFGEANLNFAGVDYQSFSRPYLTGAERLISPGSLNVLLSHNPDVFPVAARKGYDLTISGHTHGGQINFEIFDQSLSITRFFTPFIHGLYQQGSSSLYVTRGIGTVFIPARIGAPPEVALIRLCAT